MYAAYAAFAAYTATFQVALAPLLVLVVLGAIQMLAWTRSPAPRLRQPLKRVRLRLAGE